MEGLTCVVACKNLGRPDRTTENNAGEFSYFDWYGFAGAQVIPHATLLLT